MVHLSSHILSARIVSQGHGKLQARLGNKGWLGIKKEKTYPSLPMNTCPLTHGNIYFKVARISQ